MVKLDRAAAGAHMASQVAELSLECEESSQPRMAEAALRLLATVGSTPDLRMSRGG